jgi:hypothetical protein
LPALELMADRWKLTKAGDCLFIHGCEGADLDRSIGSQGRA